MEYDVSLFSPTAACEQVWFSQAVSSFEVDSQQLTRALRASVAVNVFGIGTLLPNDLGDRADSRKRGRQI